jgi:Flagellar hook-length control protein FliK
MEALPSSSGVASVSPQLQMAGTGRVGRAANGLPAFAQVVHEALHRAADSSAVQHPAVPAKASASPNAPVRAKTPNPSGRDKAQVQDAAGGVSGGNTVLLPPLLLALQAIDPKQQGQTGGSPSGNIAADNRGARSGMTTAGTVTNSGLPASAASGARASKETGSSSGTASAVLAEQIQAQFSSGLSAQLSSAAAAASSGDAASGSAGGPVGDPQASASTLPETAVGDPLAALVSQGAQLQDTQANLPPSAPPAGGPAGDPPAKASTLHNPTLVPAGDPLAALLSQGAQLQDAQAAHQPSAAPAQAGSQSQQPGESQQADKSTLVPLGVLGTKPPVVTLSTSMPRGLPSGMDETHAAAPAQAPSSSSPAHGGPQDASANHREPTPPDVTPPVDGSFPASATHDATRGAQSLPVSVAGKLDSAPLPATVATAVPNPPAATSDRAAGAGATPHQDAPAAAPAPVPFPEGAEAAANHFVNSAKLMDAAGHSEMRIAMDTDKLGAVELRARMVGDVVGAAITVEKRDTHAVLALELPALQQALSDKQLRIEQVTLLHGSLSSTMGDASASTKQDERSAAHAASRSWAADAGPISSMFLGSEPSGIFDSQGRLSVHA